MDSNNKSAVSAAAAATYTKLKDGSWGVRCAAGVTVGQAITVSKKDGSSKAETVGAILWTGIARDGRQASLVTIAPTARSHGRGKWNGCACGARELPSGGLSANACATCRFDEYDS